MIESGNMLVLTIVVLPACEINKTAVWCLWSGGLIVYCIALRENRVKERESEIERKREIRKETDTSAEGDSDREAKIDRERYIWTTAKEIERENKRKRKSDREIMKGCVCVRVVSTSLANRHTSFQIQKQKEVGVKKSKLKNSLDR